MGVLKNADSTIIALNFKPAVEVNVIYLVTKGADEHLHVFENLNLLLVRDLAAIQQGFKPEDYGYFFLTEISGRKVTVEYRGEKNLNPRIRFFSFDVDVLPNGDLKLRSDSINRF